MNSSLVARLGLTFAAAVASAFSAAPAHAEPHLYACLVIQNDTPEAVTIVLNNRTFKGSSWKIRPYDTTLLTQDGKAIKTVDGDWSLQGPPGKWRYESNRNRGEGCHGSWVFDVN